MKKFLTLAVAFLCAVAAAVAGTYTVDKIPNVHRADSTQYVSDPDGILTADARAQINEALRHVRRTSSAEAVAVIVDDIDADDINDFATDLFEKWGLGKADKDNGLLILVARDRRQATLRTGYGVEGVLPDIVCANIIRYKMAPHFKEGNYSTGMVEAVAAVDAILTDPDAVDEIFSKERDADDAGDITADDAFHIALCVAFGLSVALVVLLIMGLLKVRGRSKQQKYTELVKLKPTFLALTFLGLGMPLIASLPLIIILYRLRNSHHACPRCGAGMKKVDEVHDNEYLNPAQDLEEKLGSVDYDVWLCPQCHERDIEQYVTPSTAYRECPACHTYAMRQTRDRVLRVPTVGRAGEGVKEYCCANCGELDREPYTIPALPPVVVIPSGGGRGRGFGGGGGFGGGFGGGGFGGGHTGGGGATGGW